MNINTFYNNDGRWLDSASVSGTTRKSIYLTNQKDISDAINKGTLTVDGVTLELSDEIREAIEKANEQKKKDNANVGLMNNLIHNANVAREQADAAKEVMDDQTRAFEIARRIAKGGIVPPQDEKLLMEFNPDLYQMAKQASVLAKEHEKYKTLVEEEDKSVQESDPDEGKIDTNYQVKVEVSLGETPTVEGVKEVAVNGGSVI